MPWIRPSVGGAVVLASLPVGLLFFDASGTGLQLDHLGKTLPSITHDWELSIHTLRFFMTPLKIVMTMVYDAFTCMNDDEVVMETWSYPLVI